MSLVFAHRGFSAAYPENTMLAFQKAIEAGADGIELDVHLTKDDKIVVIHDETIDRTTNGSGEVRSFTLEELRHFDAAISKKRIFSFEPIPTLQEYFDLVRDLPLVTNIELKNGIFPYYGLEEKVLQLIHAYHLEDRILLSSFNHQSIAKCRSLAPEIARGFLYDCWLIDAGGYAKSYGAQYLHPSYYSLNSETVDEIQKKGVGLNVWTVNDPAVMEALAQKNVYGIITNDPVLCRTVLQSLKQ